MEHTSDSLILDVIDYYSSNDDRNLYPEVLYYGGRVYSDLGDYPTSLSYFRKHWITFRKTIPTDHWNHVFQARQDDYSSACDFTERQYLIWRGR